MILLREAQPRDLDALLHFAQIPGMFNLPGDADTLKERIARSQDSFAGKLKNLADTKYTFVAEDLATKRVVATSMIAGQHGTPESPHFFFTVGNEQKFSSAIGTGFIHGTLTLGTNTDGPSEIGALVVDPEHRNSPERVGRQIAFVRFLYVALRPERFKPRIIAELLPPLNKRGLSPLWEAIGRRFTNMDYWEADKLASKDKEFIFSLFPSGKIYTTFLSAEARNAIGKVGKETEPIFHMLKKIGFEYRNEVDPFDGGPHLWADASEIRPVKNTAKLRYDPSLAEGEAREADGLLAPTQAEKGQFRAIAAAVRISGDRLRLVDEAARSGIEAVLSLKPGTEVAFMPYY